MLRKTKIIYTRVCVGVGVCVCVCVCVCILERCQMINCD